VSGYQILKSAIVTVAAGATSGDQFLHCPAGKSIIAGGVLVSSTLATVVWSYPEGTFGVGWRANVRAGATEGTQLITYAVCAVVQ
jgi:hypothetical protein